jgi:hypothetical protein
LAVFHDVEASLITPPDKPRIAAESPDDGSDAWIQLQPIWLDFKMFGKVGHATDISALGMG